MSTLSQPTMLSPVATGLMRCNVVVRSACTRMRRSTVPLANRADSTCSPADRVVAGRGELPTATPSTTSGTREGSLVTSSVPTVTAFAATGGDGSSIS